MSMNIVVGIIMYNFFKCFSVRFVCVDGEFEFGDSDFCWVLKIEFVLSSFYFKLYMFFFGECCYL